MRKRQCEALATIMREASYLPLHSIERQQIEDAASRLLREARSAASSEGEER